MIEQPQDLITLQWIIITVLVTTVGYLFRELRKVEESKSVFQLELLQKVLTGLKETNETVHGLADAFELFQQQFSIREEIEKLKRELQDDKKG